MIRLNGGQLYQWDTGRTVTVEDKTIHKVQFANKGDSVALSVDVVNSVAKIPDVLLQTGRELECYGVYSSSEVVESREYAIFSVRDRAKPKDYLPTEAEEAVGELKKITQAALEAAGKAETAADKAESLITDGVVSPDYTWSSEKILQMIAQGGTGDINMAGKQIYNAKSLGTKSLHLDDLDRMMYAIIEILGYDTDYDNFHRLVVQMRHRQDDGTVLLRGIAPGSLEQDAVNLEQLDNAITKLRTYLEEALSHAYTGGNLDMQENDILNAGTVHAVSVTADGIRIQDENGDNGSCINWEKSENGNAVLGFYGALCDEPTVLRNIAPGTQPNDAVTKEQLDDALGDAEGEGSFARGEGARAISDCSVAFGKNTFAGLKGYYWSHINFEQKKIVLYTAESDADRVVPVIVTGDMSQYLDEEFETPQYDKGDEFSLINRDHFLFCGTIASVDHNIITYNEETLPIEALGIEADPQHPDNHSYSFFVPGKPDIGAALLTYGSFAEGESTHAIGEDSHAEGYGTLAGGNYAHTEGVNTQAGYCAHAEGYITKAKAKFSHSEGYETNASGVGSHAEGGETEASGKHSHAEGIRSISPGIASHAEGAETSTPGNYAHAEGYGSKAAGLYAHAEGYQTQAMETCAHSEGWVTRATGKYSHAEGTYTTAAGERSHAEGNNTQANGRCSHAEGNNTVASGPNSHVQGAYNEIDEEGKYAHIVGNGSSIEGRSNAHTVDWDGNAWFAGSVEGSAIIVKSPNGVDDNGAYMAPVDNENGNAVLEFYGNYGDEHTILRHIAPGALDADAINLKQLLAFARLFFEGHLPHIFTIDGAVCFGSRGAKWEDWCNSDCNFYGIYTENNSVYNREGDQIAAFDPDGPGHQVVADDAIDDADEYITL